MCAITGLNARPPPLLLGAMKATALSVLCTAMSQHRRCSANTCRREAGWAECKPKCQGTMEKEKPSFLPFHRPPSPRRLPTLSSPRALRYLGEAVLLPWALTPGWAPWAHPSAPSPSATFLTTMSHKSGPRQGQRDLKDPLAQSSHFTDDQTEAQEGSGLAGGGHIASKKESSLRLCLREPDNASTRPSPSVPWLAHRARPEPAAHLSLAPAKRPPLPCAHVNETRHR